MRRLIALLWFLILAASVTPQDSVSNQNVFLDQSSGWSVDDTVRFGLRNNGDLNALRDELDAERKRIAQADQRAPVSIGTDGLQEAIGRSHRYTVRGSLPLELGGRRKARVKSAEFRAQVKEWDLKNRETILASEIRNQYVVAFANASKHELIEEHLSSLLESYRLISEKVKEGKTAPLEKNMLLVEINRVRAARERSLQTTRVSIIELEKLIGRDDISGIKLRYSVNTLRQPLTLSILQKRGIDGRPDLMLLRSMEDLAEADIVTAESRNKLDATASLGYQRLRISESVKFNYLVFGITFKLPVANKGKDEIEAAVLDKQAVAKRLSFGELVVKQEIRKALIRYESAVRSREIYRNGVVSEAQNNLAVVRKMYEYGKYSLLDYLAEQRRVIKLRQELVDADLEVALSSIEIDRASNGPNLVVK